MHKYICEKMLHMSTYMEPFGTQTNVLDIHSQSEEGFSLDRYWALWVQDSGMAGFSEFGHVNVTWTTLLPLEGSNNSCEIPIQDT